VAELFSVSYETMLMMLGQFYSFGPESPAQREQLRQAAREMMSAVIRPLGEVLTQLPAGPEHPGLAAGPGFELYGDVHVSPHAENAWRVVTERLIDHSGAGLTLAEDPDAHPRLRLCAENLRRIGDNLSRAAADGFAGPPVPRPSAPHLSALSSPSGPAASARFPDAPRAATARYGTAAALEADA
jgi:hypothetical protein